MAAVLDAFAPYVKKLIADMAQDEVSMLLGVSGEIAKLEDNMESLKAFLADAERRRVTDTSVQRWVRKLKNVMYDATDILDLCQLEADKRRETKGDSGKEKVHGCFRPLLFCLRNPVFAHKIGSCIKELNQRLEGIHKEADKFKFNIGIGYNPEPRKLTASKRSGQRMTSEFDESAIVGEMIEKDTKELGHMLTNSCNHDLKVVSIVGTGGMGKTTLAQKVLNDASVQVHFKIKIWLSVTQQFDEVELLRIAIEHAGGDHGGVQDKTLLTRNLTNTLSRGRFLLVLDDVWSDEAWSRVLSVPTKMASQNQSGNWVLITTRFGDLAQRMGAPFYQHQVSPLNEEDAWSLLNKQLPQSPSQLPNWMMVPATSAFKSMRILRMVNLRCCTQLPNGLCQLPSLESLDINDAPAIKSVGPDFQSSPSSQVAGGGTITSRPVVAFPHLKTLHLAGLCEWEEWDWEEQGEDEAAGGIAMPALKSITIKNCKLRCLPAGLASSKRHALTRVSLYALSKLTYVENFPSVVELRLKDCPMLKRISILSRLQKITILRCPNVEVLERVPVLYSMEMEDGTMETLPRYVSEVRPRYLRLSCSKKLYESLLAGSSSSEYNKISHIEVTHYQLLQ